MASELCPQIPKLKGSDDYPSWQFAVQALLQLDNLWAIVAGEETETDASVLTKLDCQAKARLIMMVEPSNYVHIMIEKTAKGMWTKLRITFQDSSWVRRVRLIRSLIAATTRLDQSTTMDEFVAPIMSTVHQLHHAGLGVDDQFVGVLLLGGLDGRFEPMIRGLDSSGVQHSSAAIMAKLLRIDLSTLRRQTVYKRRIPTVKQDSATESLANNSFD